MKKSLSILLVALFGASAAFAQLTSPTASPGAPAQVTPTATPAYVPGDYVPLQHATFTLTAAQIKALNTTPVTILPAQGSGKTIVLVGPVDIRYTRATASFTGGGALVIQYHTNTVAATGTLAANTITAGNNTENVILPVATAVTAGTGVQNDPLEVTCATADFGGSTAAGTITIDFYYRVI